MKNALLNEIRKELNIPETEGKEGVFQVVYSVAGQMALASLWDPTEDRKSAEDRDLSEDSEPVSILHFKTRMKRIFEAYGTLFPEVQELSIDELIDDIYDVYRRTGYLYHSSRRISASIPGVASSCDLTLHRGFSPDAKLSMSGLGFYRVQDQSTEETEKSVSNLFGLQEQSFDAYLEELLEKGEWAEDSFSDEAEYLLLEPRFGKKYWKPDADKDERISLARSGNPKKRYVFYRCDNGRYLQKEIPVWRLRDFFSEKKDDFGEYRRIAVALLMRYETLPPISVKKEGELCEIHLGYRLPLSEESFFKLYSWPIFEEYRHTESDRLSEAESAMKLKKRKGTFKRKMSTRVYPMFKRELESLGYCFSEE